MNLKGYWIVYRHAKKLLMLDTCSGGEVDKYAVGQNTRNQQQIFDLMQDVLSINQEEAAPR